MGLFGKKPDALATPGRCSSIAYSGHNKIVIAFQIGLETTTAAFAYLRLGERPQVHKITKWPGHKDDVFNAEVATIVVYHKPDFVGCGAQAPEFRQQPGYIAERSFPKYLNAFGTDAEKTMTPPRVPLEQIYRDFLRYIHDTIRLAFQSSIPDGSDIWKRLYGTIDSVILIPDSWGDVQKDLVRQAAVEAEICDRSRADSAISFVSDPSPLLHVASEGFGGVRLANGEHLGILTTGHRSTDLDLYLCLEASREPILHQEQTVALHSSPSALPGMMAIGDNLHSFLKNSDPNWLLRGWKKHYLETFDGETPTSQGLATYDWSSTRLYLNQSHMCSVFSAHIDAFTRAVENLSPPPKYLIATGDLFLSPYLIKAFSPRCGQLDIKLVVLGGCTVLVQAAVLLHARRSTFSESSFRTRPVSTHQQVQPSEATHSTQSWANGYYGDSEVEQPLPSSTVYQHPAQPPAGASWPASPYGQTEEDPPHYNEVNPNLTTLHNTMTSLAVENQRLRLELDAARAGRSPPSSPVDSPTSFSQRQDAKSVLRIFRRRQSESTPTVLN